MNNPLIKMIKKIKKINCTCSQEHVMAINCNGKNSMIHTVNIE